VGVHPTGIQDFATGESMSPIDLVMRATQADLDPAVRWLSNAIGIDQETAFREDVQGTAPLTTGGGYCEEVNGSKGPTLLTPAAPKPARDLSNAPWRRKSVASPPPLPFSGDLPVPRGALGMLTRHITATAYRPQPILDLGASLCALGTLAGRKYKFDNLRTNMYVVGLADSGAGKEHARTVIDNLFANDLGVGDRLGGAKIASGAGLLTAVRRSPAILFQLDEFGAILHGIADRERSPKHLSEILIHLTQLFTSADKTYRGVEFADQKSRPREEIIEPCLNLYGTTVPSNFWKALESNNSIDGSLARFIVLESAYNYPDGQIKPQVQPPAELIDICKRIIGDVQNDFRLDARHPPAQTEVVCSPEASVVINAAAAWETEQLRLLEGTQFTSFYARRSEIAKKIAMIHAIGLNPEDPVVSVEDINLGIAIADKSIALMVSGVERFVSDNTSESFAKRVVEVIRAKGGPISRSELYKKTLFLGRERDSTMRALVNSDQIIEDFIMATGGAPKMVYRIKENPAR